MKYKLLKDLPGIKAGKEFIENDFQPTYSTHEIDGVLFIGKEFANDNLDFFKPIKEKKTYDDLKIEDTVFEIQYDGSIEHDIFSKENCRSETFLTREEAEDEHKRREWACRKDRFVPKEGDNYFYLTEEGDIEADNNSGYAHNIIFINLGIVFQTREECQDAIYNHDLIRLFYTIR